MLVDRASRLAWPLAPDLWVEHYATLDEDGRQLLPVKPVHFFDRDALG